MNGEEAIRRNAARAAQAAAAVPVT